MGVKEVVVVNEEIGWLEINDDEGKGINNVGWWFEIMEVVEMFEEEVLFEMKFVIG